MFSASKKKIANVEFRDGFTKRLLRRQGTRALVVYIASLYTGWLGFGRGKNAIVNV
jgi:hypothetical protein